MTFEIKQKCHLNAITPRPEKDQDKGPTVYLAMSTDCSNSILAGFHPNLRDMLFKESDDPDLVDDAEGNTPTTPRFPNMGTLKWDQALTGCTVTVDYGLGGPSDIVLEDCTVDKFRFQPKNGGTVTVFFRVVTHPGADAAGLLVEMIDRDIELEIKLPPAKTAADLFPKAA